MLDGLVMERYIVWAENVSFYEADTAAEHENRITVLDDEARRESGLLL